MRTNHSTTDAAIQELDLIADTLTDRSTPHWQIDRVHAGYKVIVYLPFRYVGCEQTRAYTDFATVEVCRPSMVDAVNAAIEQLRDIPIGHSVLDVLAVEAVL